MTPHIKHQVFPNLKNNWKYAFSLLEAVVNNTTGNHIPDTGILFRAFNTSKSRRLFLVSFITAINCITRKKPATFCKSLTNFCTVHLATV